MPRLPDVQHLNATSADILNAIRNNASPQYQNLIPAADSTTESIREIGSVMMIYQPLQNEFLSALVNRIGRVILTSKLYENPWASFKKGLLEYGETVEEIFVNIAKPFQFNPEQAEKTVWKREIPDVRSAFHTMNYQKYYKATVSNDQLRTAFLSWNGITDLIAKIVDAMYTGANYDEFQTMKYMLADCILKGLIGSTQITTVNAANMKSIISTIKGFSNEMEFMSKDRNLAGVMTYTNKNDQFVIINAKFEAQMDVEVLAAAFNMDRAEFMGHLVMIDGFGHLDTERLQELLGENPGYTAVTDAQKTALDQIPVVIVSREFFMMFDNFYNFTELYNGEGLYWNYWYHTWKTFSISPFGEAQIFTPQASTVTAVNIVPATATVPKGSTIQLSATVTGTGFVSQLVDWSISDNATTNHASVNSEGLVTVPSDFDGTRATITAKSKANPVSAGTSVLTIT